MHQQFSDMLNAGSTRCCALCILQCPRCCFRSLPSEQFLSSEHMQKLIALNVRRECVCQVIVRWSFIGETIHEHFVSDVLLLRRHTWKFIDLHCV
jgi:hypothetical protein